MEDFDPDHWFVAGGSPLELPVEPSKSSRESRHWGDQADFEELLPHAWHARRTNDWSYFVPLVREVCERPAFERWQSPASRALYNALNHMLLFAGNGRHPIELLQEYLDSNFEEDVFAGTSAAFRSCFEPLLQEMWQWWVVSAFAPHNRAGTAVESVEIDFDLIDPSAAALIAETDPLHLSGHCGAPLGQDWTESDALDICDTGLEIHTPRLFTVHGSSYLGWMARLRNIEVTFPVLVKVTIDGEPNEVTLGYWALVPLEDRTDFACSRAIFVPDHAMLTMIAVVEQTPELLMGNASRADSRLPSSMPLGLFDGVEDVDLQQLLVSKEFIRALLIKALEVADDTFMISIDADDEPIAYVQGIVEDERMLHVELSHEDMIEVHLPPDDRAVIVRQGWNPPDEDFPNYWLLLNREEWANERIADLLVDALDYAFHAFSNPDPDLTFEVRPMELAMKIVPDDVETKAMRAPGERDWILVDDEFPFDSSD